MFDESLLRYVLHQRPFRYVPQVSSTNDLAREWLLAGALSGAVVIADEQLAGRGRQGRTWHTPPGVGLALSVILRPDRAALHQVTMLGALAISDVLLSMGVRDVGIKWANDVLLRGRKVSGVLSEAVWQGDTLAGVVLGIGVNVRVNFTGTELENRAISIEHLPGIRVNRLHLLATVLRRVDAWAERLGTDELFETWRARLVTPGQRVTVHSLANGTTAAITGLAQGVEPSGALLVRDDHGEIQRVVAGDLEIH